MLLFHRTTAANAVAILSEGFSDRTGSYMTDATLTGVWLSDRPLDANEGQVGDGLLVVDLELTTSALAAYEVVEADKPYREWLIPAEVIAAFGRTCHATPAEEEVAILPDHLRKKIERGERIEPEDFFR